MPSREEATQSSARRWTTWARIKVILGLAIGAGYIYNLAVEGPPAPDASSFEKGSFYFGTGLGMLIAVLLVLSGLRGRARKT